MTYRAPPLRAERLAASMEGDFVVFLIGMRINKLWKVHKWWPVAQAMPRMLDELATRPEAGMLAGEMWFGRTSIMVQYWRSIEQLMAYAKDRNAKHLPAWRAFNRAVGTSGDVGIWHETYSVSQGRYENIYVNMPAFGLGKVGALQPATGAKESAEARLEHAVSGRTTPVATPVDVFFYGLFMDVELLRSQAVVPMRARRAFVDDVALRIGERATLMPMAGARAYGMLIALMPDDVARLYAAPGLQHYRPQAVLAHTIEGQTVPALCYTLAQPPSAAERNQAYAAQLKAVLQRLDFPAEYVASLE